MLAIDRVDAYDAEGNYIDNISINIWWLSYYDTEKTPTGELGEVFYAMGNTLKAISGLDEIDPTYKGLAIADFGAVMIPNAVVEEILFKGGSLKLYSNAHVDADAKTRWPIAGFMYGEFVNDENSYSEIYDDGSLVINFAGGSEATIYDNDKTLLAFPTLIIQDPRFTIDTPIGPGPSILLTFVSGDGYFESDGSISKVVSFVSGVAVSIADLVEIPVKPSYVVTHWVDESGSVYYSDELYQIAEDIVFTAVYELNPDIGIIDIVHDYLADRVAGTITQYDNENIVNVSDFAFAGCKSLTFVSLPKVTRIGNSAFQYCSSLTSVSLPKATRIGNSAFFKCSSLTLASLPAATDIGSFAFEYCSSLTSVSLPAATSICSAAFRECSSLTSVSLPKCNYIGSYAFKNCKILTSVSLPTVTSIDVGAFIDCSTLTSVSLPKASYIGNNAFIYCTNLTSIYLTGSYKCSLGGSSAFYLTKIASGTGYIYVPTSLVTAYKSYGYWSYISSRISGI